MSALGARVLVFFTAAAVLVLEIMAGRLMAPYVGVTLETFTGIIGTVLAGIAVGSWLGGMAADRFNPARLLGPLLLAGGGLALLSPTLVEWVGPSMTAARALEIVALTGAAFFAPAMVLSAVQPTVVKLRLADLDETGTVVGRLTGIATAGAIFGTFVTGFLLIAALPSRPIILGLGGILIIAGVVIAIRYGFRSGAAAAALIITIAASGLLVAVEGPCDTETAYFCARVTADPERDSGRVLWLDTLRHSYVDLEDPGYLGFRYARLVSDTVEALIPEGPLSALYIGGGGFTLPRYFSHLRPGTENTVMELDPVVVDIAREDLGLSADDNIEILTGDARLRLDDTPRQTFNLVVGDAFGGPSVPWHLTTIEFVEDVHSRMTPEGVYVLNLIDFPPTRFARAEAATFQAVFDHVAVVAPGNYIDGDRGGNFVLVGSNQFIDDRLIQEITSERGGDEITIIDPDVTDFVDGERPLRDDFAPVDQLISRP